METNIYNPAEVLSMLGQQLKRYFLFILLASLAAAIGGYLWGRILPTKYTALSTIYPDKEADTQGSPLDLISGGLGNKTSTVVLAEVIRSRTISQSSANREITPDVYNQPPKKYPYLGYWILEDANKAFYPWQKKYNLQKMTRKEIVLAASNILRSNAVGLVDEHGFFSVYTSAYTSALAGAINEITLQELIKFNFDKKTAKARGDLEYINRRTDSIKEIYDRLVYNTAEFLDVNQFGKKAVVNVPKDQMLLQKTIYESRYRKLVEMQENAVIRYQQSTPVVSVLDYPYPPFTQEVPPRIKYALIAFVSVLFLSCVMACWSILTEIVKTEIKTALRPNKVEEDSTPPPSVL